MAEESNQANQVTEELRRAEEERRKNAAEFAQKGTERARQQSMETLQEQEQSRPDPSQEEADRIKVGARTRANAEVVEQPEGPAQRREAELDAANKESMVATNPVAYATRDMAAQQPERRGPGRPRRNE